MGREHLLLQLIIAASALIYAILAGRAQASRMRGLHADISNGKLRGTLTVAVVTAMVLFSLAL